MAAIQAVVHVFLKHIDQGEGGAPEEEAAVQRCPASQVSL